MSTHSLTMLDDALSEYEALKDAVVPVATLKERVASWGTMRKRRERKPSVATLIKRAEKAGKTVTAITTAGGVTLTFGNTVSGNGAAASLDLDRELEEFEARHAT
jgi:putative intracellular protease/amidase